MAMNVSESDLLRLKRAVQDGKDKLTAAQATLTELTRSVDSLNEELKALGVEPDQAAQWLLNKEEEITKAYNELLAKIPK